MIRWILCLFILWLEYYESEKACEGKRYCEDIILVFGYDRTLIKSIKDSGFRSMSDVISYANNMVVDKPIDHIRVSNEARGWCGSYTNYGKMID